MTPRFVGRFTARGDDGVEARIHALVGRVAEVVTRELRPEALVALVLMGGYGRGEGGVEQTSTGEQIPHNNLDFMLVTRGEPEIKSRIDDRLRPLVREEGVGIDLSVISARRLRRATPLVMWYDLRFGHKTVLGDAGFVPSLARFTPESIVAWDVRNLLTNRGSLLVINDLLLARGASGTRDLRTIVKHMVKCVIGYGDALLYFLGDYHWSYLEKKKRMALRRDVAPEFRALYEDCAEFRLEPRYDRFIGRDLKVWADEMRTALAPIHLICEQKRLGVAGLSWDEYVTRALRGVIRDEWASPRAWARKVRNGLRRTPGSSQLGALARVGLRAAGVNGALSIAFPAVAYGLGGEARAFAVELLGVTPEVSRTELARAYLRTWGEAVDQNARHVYSELKLDIFNDAGQR